MRTDEKQFAVNRSASKSNSLISSKEARNPKSESDLSNPVEKMLRYWLIELKHSDFGLRISFGSRISDFGLIESRN